MARVAEGFDTETVREQPFERAAVIALLRTAAEILEPSETRVFVPRWSADSEPTVESMMRYPSIRKAAIVIAGSVANTGDEGEADFVLPSSGDEDDEGYEVAVSGLLGGEYAYWSDLGMLVRHIGDMLEDPTT
ncbi:MAG: hypothetical protein HC888_02590 [Candidatus Competibacteraceae bacterium]|nr:hypothetical protein [Candidatus Competibacteraceae bacterium]